MSEKLNHADELEELSLLIDEMNAGRRPVCANAEIAELLAVADLIRKAGGPVCPPQHILKQTVDRAFTGIEASNRKSARRWWFSGALSTAAAVILIIGLNLLPLGQHQWPVAPPPLTASHRQDTSQSKPVTEMSPAVSQPSSVAMPKPTDTTPATKEQPPTDGQQQSRQASVQTPQVKPSPPPTSPQENFAIQEEPPRPAQPPQIALSKSAVFAPDLIPAAPKSDQPAIRPLKIPGQKPDTVAFDQKNGALRQVYYQGTMQEITITQQFCPQDADNNKNKLQAPVVISKADAKPDSVNIIKVIIADWEVTITGRQSPQELLRLADTLTP